MRNRTVGNRSGHHTDGNRTEKHPGGNRNGNTIGGNRNGNDTGLGCQTCLRDGGEIGIGIGRLGQELEDWDRNWKIGTGMGIA